MKSTIPPAARGSIAFCLLIAAAAALLAVAAIALADGSPSTPIKAPPATAVPVSREQDAVWLAKHNQYVAETLCNPDLIFLGDSITDIWDLYGREAWGKHYGAMGSMKVAQFGISADRTQNILWRVQHGEVAKPKVVVLLTGTNNIWDNSGADIAQGAQAIINEILQRSPGTKILLMGVFPRGEKPATGERDNVTKMNVELAKLANDKSVYFMDIGNAFLQPDGTISKDILVDFIHPSSKGYEIWASAIDQRLHMLLGN